MAISETSNAPSRTIGLKPLLVGEYSAKSSVTESDLTAPLFRAAVPGWSPSNVRKCAVTSVGLGIVEIDQAGLRQRFAHLVEVEAEHAGSQLPTLAVFLCKTLLAFGGDLPCIPLPHHDNSVIVSNHGIAGFDIDACADHGNVDGAESRLDGAL